MRSLSLALIALALAAVVALPAHAAAPKPTIVVAVPVAFDYTEDKGQPDVKANSPTGARAHFVTPFYLGLGIATYKSAVKASSVPGLPGDLGTTYNLTELSANVTFGPVMLGYGYGAGNVSYSPRTQSTPILPGLSYQVKRKDSPVVERFITVGIYLGASWSIQAAWHALIAQSNEELSFNGVNPVSHKGDIGAVMTTAGVGYSF